MNIFAEVPQSWIDLQNKVAYILQCSGFEVDTPKKVATVRSDIEFDVFAQNKDISVACECKYWKRKVPQNVVQAFRSQLDDVGINKGYIISMHGFQRGSYESADSTIIELRTWNDFMNEYRDLYLREQIGALLKIKRPVFRVAYDKSEYWTVFDKLTPENKRVIHILRDRLLQLFLLFAPLCDAIQYEYTDDLGWDVDYIDSVISYAAKTTETVFPCYCDFFEWINDQITTTVRQIEKIYEMQII